MRIVNKTMWRTDQLRAIVGRVAQDELDPERRRYLEVFVEYRRANACVIGRAPRGGYRMKITIERKNVDRALLAHIIAHEMAHIRGLRHSEMRGSVRYDYKEGWREYYAWADQMPLERKQVKQELKEDVQLVRYNRVIDRQRAWATKLKRAQTALKKLSRQRRYYEKVLMAAGKLPDQSGGSLQHTIRQGTPPSVS